MDAASFFREANTELGRSLMAEARLRSRTLRCLDPVAPALDGDRPAAAGCYASLSPAGAVTRIVTMSAPWYC